jgi:WD40 repeat protein
MMSEAPSLEGQPLAESVARQVDQVCNRFEAACKAGTRPRIEDFLSDTPEPARSALLRELVVLEAYYRRARGESCPTHEYQARFPHLDPTWLAEALAGDSQPVALAVRPGEATTPPEAETLAAEAAGNLVGQVGDYELLQEIARGGMGVVFKARQKSLNRVVALKMILAGQLASPAEVQRFRAEADAIARLNHPNIVTIYEVGEHQGLPYLALEYVGGGSLAQQTRGSPQPARDAAVLVETLARAMHAAHEAGVVHRDLKPANVLLSFSGRLESGVDSAPLSERPLTEWAPKITDFGLAKQARAELTATGAVLGTPSYMAPEQAAGDNAAVGPAADVYALGAILYELLTGRPPFRGVSVLETLEQVRTREPASPRLLQPGVPRDLETVCLKCLQKEPAKRYASAEALAEDLRRFGAGEPVRARPVGAVGRLHKWARRRPAVAVLLGLVAVVGAAGLGGILWAYGQARDEAENTRLEKQRADDKAAEALQKEKEALWQAHLAQLGRVDAQLLVGDHVGALRVLDDVRPEYRGWEYGYLRGRAEGTPLVLRGHAGVVRSVCYSPDGTRLASGALDQTVRLWDAKSGVELATLRGHTGGVSSVCYTPDGTRLASASGDKTVKLWDAQRGTEIATLRGHTSVVYSVCYSPDGSRLASAAGDQSIKIWDTASGAEQATLRGHTSWVTAVSYSPDGRRLASASYDKTVKIWDAHSGTEVATLRGHTSVVYSVCYNPDGTHLASASQDKTVKLWDAHSGTEIATLRGHTSVVHSVCYSPDGARLASAAQEGTARIWDAKSGAHLATLTDAVWSAVYSPDGTRLASAAGDGTVKLWDATSGTPIATLRGHSSAVRWVCCSPDGTRLASASGDSTIKLWDTRSGAPIATLRGHTAWVSSVAYSPDGTRLASASADQTVRLWDAKSGALLATLRGHAKGVTAVCYSPDGTRLASASYDQTVKVWDAHSGGAIATLRGYTGPVYSVCYSPDGTRLASASTDQTIKVWDAATGAEVANLGRRGFGLLSVVYSPDGTRIASAAQLEIKLLDAHSGALLATLRGHAAPVNAVCYSPNGTRLASASQDHTVKVWDAGNGAELATVRGHTLSVECVCYSPDGSRLVSGSWDHTGMVHGAHSGAPLTVLRGHSAAVHSVGYSLEGTRLLSADVSGEVLVWDTATGKPLADEKPPQPLPTDNATPDGHFTAVPHGTDVQIFRRRPMSGGYDPWAEDAQRRRAQAPLWHATQAAAAKERGDAFAAAFHRRRLAEGDNLRLLAWARLAGGDTDGCRQALQQLREVQRGSAVAWQLSGVLASALPVRPGLAAPVGPLVAVDLARPEQLRRAAQLVWAAALVPDSRIDAAELVGLARFGVEADPQSWQARELLGAALYRDGKAAEALRELDEALRQHGAAGSLWSRLFLALAHRRLGHAQQAQEWRDKAERADTWEDAVVQRQLLGELGAAVRPTKP